MKTKLNIVLALLAVCTFPTQAEEVPKELLVPKAGLDSDKTVRKELLLKAEVDNSAYFLVEQTPKEGPRDLVLIEQKPGKTAKFLAGGSITDLLQAKTSPEVKKQVAEAFVLMERDRVSAKNAGFSVAAMTRYQTRVKEEADRGMIPKALIEAYRSTGTIK